MAGIPPAPIHLLRTLAKGWWLFMLRGLVAILFAGIAFALPAAGLAVMLAFLAAWLAVEGATTLWHAAADKDRHHGLWFWLDGLVSLAAAALLLLWPGESAIGLVIVTGAWAVAVGLLRLVLAFRTSSVLLGLLGAVTVFFGAWMVAQPGPGLLALIWLVGLQALVMGAVLVGLGWRLRRIAQDPHHHA